MLDDILAKLDALSEKKRAEVINLAMDSTKGMRWVPNPGPQTDAFYCEADELFYGGSAGGGKSALGVGLATTSHERSLILRRINKDAKKLAEAELLGKIMDGDRNGWNGQEAILRKDGRVIEFGGCEMEEDKQRYKGDPHDLIVFDEVTDFLESQYTFISIWNRSTTPGQQCRVVATGNPPTNAEGLWVIHHWSAWLDPEHPNPAKAGELRYYLRDEDDIEREVDGRGPHLVDGHEVYARSRTFIPAKLSDNPDLNEDGEYKRLLDAMPKELRDAYRDGHFRAVLDDAPQQLIPSAWVQQAQARWTKNPPEGIPQCALGVDVAQGGKDKSIIAARHDGWYDELIKIAGKDTPLGTDLLGPIMAARRDNSKIILDVGGGYGSDTYKSLIDNSIPVIPHKGAKASSKTSEDRLYHFFNKRAEVYWQFKEALDPARPGGSCIALPPDTTLFADLTSILFSIEKHQSGLMVKLETKEKLVKRIGRSPDHADAVVNAWSAGDKMADSHNHWSANNTKLGRRPKVLMSTRRSRRSG